MPTQMVVTDLDKTLLKSDKTISGYTHATLEALHRRGIRVVYATARPLRTLKPYLFEGLPDALIFHNGAVVREGERTLWREGIPVPVAAQILQAMAHMNPEATLSVEIEDRLYANFDVSIHWDNTSATQTNFTDLPDDMADKLIVGLRSPEEFPLYAGLLPEDLYIELNDGKLGLIHHRRATKAQAVRRLAAHWGIPLADTVAFGDDLNDLTMLRECGTGIAMANALPEVKAVADEICGGNDEDGVAHWLWEHVLE